MSERLAVLLPLLSQYLTSYCFFYYYLLMINEGAVKTVHRVKETDREAPPSLLLREDF